MVENLREVLDTVINEAMRRKVDKNYSLSRKLTNHVPHQQIELLANLHTACKFVKQKYLKLIQQRH
jgi:DNA-binding transcriptional regulator GbsR (MarR family)